MGQQAPFLLNEKFLGLGDPIGESGTPACLRMLKILPINFSSQKPVGLFDSYFKSTYPLLFRTWQPC